MTDQKPIRIILFVGLAGSGKSSVVDYLTHKGYPKVVFGSVVLNALDDAGLEHTPENETMMRAKLRQEHGETIIVDRIIEQIHGIVAAGQRHIIADGLDAWETYKQLKHAFPGELTTVALTSSRHLRHHRLANRTIRPMTEAEVTERDINEIEHLNKGGVIAMADYFISNDGTIEQLNQTVGELLESIGFYSSK